MGKGLFVTGTDTDVGKTIATATLLTILRSAGIDAVPMKPIQTGCTENGGDLLAPDLEFLLASIDYKPSLNERELMCPYRYTTSCSPHLAAGKESSVISMNKICECFGELQAEHDVVVVEGAGGVMVPLNSRNTMLDLMQMLAVPVALVARLALGTLNHSLLSIQAIKQAELRIAGVILNEMRGFGEGDIERDNRRMIGVMGEVHMLGSIPLLPEEGCALSELVNMPSADELMRRLS